MRPRDPQRQEDETTQIYRYFLSRGNLTHDIDQAEAETHLQALEALLRSLARYFCTRALLFCTVM